MTVAEYESYFHDLARNIISIFDTRHDIVHCFVRGFRLPINMSTQSLAALGKSFAQVSDHTRVIMEMHCEGCEGHNKSTRF